MLLPRFALCAALCAAIASASSLRAGFSHTKYAEFAQSMYCPNTQRLKDWRCNTCKNGLQKVTIINDSKATLQAMVAYHPGANEIVVAFRGSSNLKNWIANLDARLESWSVCSHCRVHSGFLSNYKKLRNGVFSALQAMKNTYSTAKIALTGHSMGGALATLAAADFVSGGVPVHSLTTFGQPRTGDNAFVNYVNQQVRTIHRVTHGSDVVVHVPTGSYGHVGTEIFYPRGKPSNPIVCSGSKDSRCSSGTNAFSRTISGFDDHRRYVGVNMGGEACS